jgi:hypothetical protein
MADELRVPRKVNGVWDPFNPSEWRAYAPRQRLFRTPNDAYMTGNFHVAETVMQKVLKNQGYGWVQLLLASVYSGAFHPSAEGQAAIADAVVERARAVLVKYASRARHRRRRDGPRLDRWPGGRSVRARLSARAEARATPEGGRRGARPLRTGCE